MLVQTVLMLLALAVSADEVQPCADPDSPRQMVIARGTGDFSESWNPEPGELHALAFSNGVRLGVEVTPVDADFYRARIGERDAYMERVRISLYNLRKDPPELLSTTYGGADSIQGFSASGGANTIEQLGEERLRLHLIKPNCIRATELADTDD